ncbi:hypothetical protein AXA44_11280 [Rhodococcus sp. SC4]|nr:hypothetical protein AXA44_11280 [Rhodococcus sp. SC4]RZL80728.1 MAG: acyltransferase [Rhodococcus sp. (in: high G+C Gram-positive bacteria)]
MGNTHEVPSKIGAKGSMIPTLTGLRAIAALWVVIEHFRQPLYALVPVTERLRQWIEPGFLGVEIFFILSGFIIAYQYGERLSAFTPTAYRRYVQARFARIYPVHLITLLMVTVLVVGASIASVKLNSAENYSTVSFLGNLLMLQGFSAVGAWNGPAWSITCEFAAYLAFPLLAIWIVRFRSSRTAFTVAAVTLTAGTTAVITYLLIVNDSPTADWMPWLRIAFEFTAGTLLYTGWRLCRKTRSVRWDWIAAVGFGTAAVILYFVPHGTAWTFIVLPLLAMFVVGCAGASGVVQTFLGTRVMQWGGRISYSLYMVHFIVLNIGGKLLSWNEFTDAALFVRLGVVLAYFAVAVVAADLLYRTIEEPARTRSLSYLSRRESRRSEHREDSPSTPRT